MPRLLVDPAASSSAIRVAGGRSVVGAQLEAAVAALADEGVQIDNTHLTEGVVLDPAF